MRRGHGGSGPLALLFWIFAMLIMAMFHMAVTLPRTAWREAVYRWQQITLASKRCFRSFIRNFFRICGIVLLTEAVMAGAVYYYIFHYACDMPKLEPFIRFEPPTIGQVYDEKGQTLVELAKEYRRIIQYGEIPAVVEHATLSAEDKRFFSHRGIDPWALIRVAAKVVKYSVAASFREGKLVIIMPQGGSSITQQLFRSYFLQEMLQKEKDNGSKLRRKLKEIRGSMWLEAEMAKHYGSKRRAKEEILARYASFVYLSNGRYGFQAGSEYLFGKPLAQVSLEEAAVLAGITKSPAEYAPSKTNVKKPLRRRNDILKLMAANKYITPFQAGILAQKPLRVADRDPVKTIAPAVVEHVLEEVRKQGKEEFTIDQLFEGRIQVHSTANKRIQEITNEALEKGIADYENGVRNVRPGHPEAKGLVQGSVVVLRNSDGAILAEVGGRKFFKNRLNAYSDYNRVTDSSRQPGSAFKPFVYLAALKNKKDWDLDTRVVDAPIAVRMGGGQLHWISNYDEKFKGIIPFRQALAESRNAATTWITYQVGIRNVVQTAYLMGIKTKLHVEPSTALGASEVNLIELTNAYRAIASGLLAEPHVIDTVTDRAGKVVFKASKKTPLVPIDMARLALMQEGLRGVIRLDGGTAHSLDATSFPIPVAGKTGTTTDFKDAIFVGWTYGADGITIGVRVGFDNPGMGYDEDGRWGLGPKRGLGNKETGGRTALPVFREIALRVYKEKLAGPVPQFPPEIETHIDEYKGIIAQVPK